MTAEAILDELASWAARLLRVRWLVRLPILAFRARLGAMFLGRLLMLEHLGRRSGEWRSGVLEVVGHDDTHTYVVVSGFGERSQWFRNVSVHPEVRVWIKSRRPVAAKARRLSTTEAAASLAAYRRAHPRAWSQLRPVLERALGAPIDEEHPSLPMVALDLERSA